MVPGHVLIDRQGAILEADAGFGSLLMAPPESLRGRDVLSITAPADRAECAQAIAGLIETGRSFDIVKRFLRSNETVLWVRNSVSLMAVNSQNLVVATCTPILNQAARRAPSSLLSSARHQLAMLRERKCLSDPLLLSGPSWHLLLEIYLAEAEGRAIDVASLALKVEQNANTVARWIAALAGSGLLEVETHDPRPDLAKAYRLTSNTMGRLETYLVKFAAYEPPPI